MIYKLVIELGDRGVDVNELAARPEFVTALHDATRIALGEHLLQKLDMLISILHSAADRPADRVADIVTLRYLRWVDEFEPEHVLLMRRAGIRTTVSGRAESKDPEDQLVVEETKKIDLGQRALMVEELDARGLIKGHRIHSASETIERHAAAAAGHTPSREHEEARAAANLSNASLTPRGRDFLTWVGHMS